MKRTIVSIDENLCTGCGECIPGCPEGALQVIDGKARLVSDLFCDGLGACINTCPYGAISIEEREAEPYDERSVMEKSIVPAAGCPGSAARQFSSTCHEPHVEQAPFPSISRLAHWPVQLHLVNPQAPCYREADLLLAADCAAFAAGDFHERFMSGRSLAIACPKLDSGIDRYIEKLAAMIDMAGLTSITVAIMEVPCCGGLMTIVEQALARASRPVPVRLVVISVQGDVLSDGAVVSAGS
ncbi:MAG TPA: 4Fe-4S dicluster domain-containing protein [Prosthecochloris aestuarii]|uniref:4Fe-4S dicluster domain-containing protein n=1 Tax=Prosthecochloris aestuarii TaxID=1102 RepID=A0A831SSZ3_PROAE|nr:4Fe-4S binding protein [Prosthecochloris sp.]HED31174.1 4Fe-4S dicluster domain-containing protein [Prosthecochloris aestuarii]